MTDWNPLVLAAAGWLAWSPWKWLVLGLVVWHGMIGKANAVRWLEALGWQGVLGMLTRMGWVQQPPPPPAEPVEQPRIVRAAP